MLVDNLCFNLRSKRASISFWLELSTFMLEVPAHQPQTCGSRQMTNGTLSASEKISALQKADMFRGLSESLLREIANRATVRRFHKEEIIVSERDDASGIYVVVEGELRSIRQNRQGREQVLSTESPGAVLAAVPVFNGGKFYSTLIADTDATVLCINVHDTHELCREHPELLWNVAKLLAHKVRHYAELIETLALRNIDQRVAQYFLTACQEQATPSRERGRAFELKITQTEMASRVGSTREVVCRSIGHLRKTGLIHVHGNKIEVPDLRALSRFAGTDQPLEEPRLVSELSSDIA
jgi:CRP/FNR family transcriptional regulator